MSLREDKPSLAVVTADKGDHTQCFLSGGGGDDGGGALSPLQRQDGAIALTTDF